MFAIINALLREATALLDKRDARTINLPFMSIWSLLALTISYTYFSINLGPRLMKNRPSVDCRRAMIVYNVLQVLINTALFLEVSLTVWVPMKLSIICAEIDFSNDPFNDKLAKFVWFYYMLKILDCIDTVFMVLRKKHGQISFLHVYHHGGMMIIGWVGANFFGGGASILLGTINAFVHAVMYSYYLLTSLYPEYGKNISWKRRITEIQMVQFFIIGLHFIIHIVNPYCNFPKLALCAFLPHNIIITIMFYDFYKKAYLTPKTDEGKTKTA